MFIIIMIDHNIIPIQKSIIIDVNIGNNTTIKLNVNDMSNNNEVVSYSEIEFKYFLIDFKENILIL